MSILLRRLKREEKGFILATSMIILLVLLLTMAALTVAASDNTTTASHTGSTAKALAAAQAGEQVALDRLNVAGATGSTGATFGNGAAYRYTITSLLNSSSPCAGLYVQNPTTLNEDCIQSTGTAQGVSQTVEERVAGYPPQTLFPLTGLFSNYGISACSFVVGGASTPTNIGSNGSISFCNSLTMTGTMQYYLGSGASQPYCWNNPCATNSGCSNSCVMSQQSGATTLGALSNTTWNNAYSTGTADDSNSLINWGGVTPPTSGNDWMVGGSSFNNDTIQLPGGVYFFCGINLAANDQIQYETESGDTSPVQIYIGSTSGPGSDCPSAGTALNNSGPLTIGCTSTSSGCSPVEPSDDIQIYAYGNPSGCTASSTGSCPGITSTAAFTANADIFAPFSAITGQNGWTLTGAAAVGFVSSTNTMTINYPATGGMPASTGSTTFYPTASGICPNSYASAGC